MKTAFPAFRFSCLLLILIMAGGCDTLTGSTVVKEKPITAADPVKPTPPAARYLDFPDVKIPSQFKVNRNASFIYQSDNITGGLLALSGKMSPDEAISWFQRNMPQDGWEPLSSFKYQKFILIYTKSGKVCLIEALEAKPLSDLVVEIWVAPTRGQASGSMPHPGVKAPVGPKEETIGQP